MARIGAKTGGSCRLINFLVTEKSDFDEELSRSRQNQDIPKMVELLHLASENRLVAFFTLRWRYPGHGAVRR
jgi:hypothetical protein